MHTGKIGVALVLAVLLSSPVFAGAPEDFADGSKAYLAGDVVGSMPLLRRAADAGHAPAQVMLGDILDKSEFDEEAVVYFRKAADQGSADGQFGLGSMYSSGEGVKKDLAIARKWITMAAEQGQKQAIGVMAQAFISGQLNVSEQERQGEEARRWIRKSADLGYLPAVDALMLAYRNGEFGLEPDAAEAARWQAKGNELRNILPGSRKGKARNKEIKK